MIGSIFSRRGKASQVQSCPLQLGTKNSNKSRFSVIIPLLPGKVTWAVLSASLLLQLSYMPNGMEIMLYRAVFLELGHPVFTLCCCYYVHTTYTTSVHDICTISDSQTSGADQRAKVHAVSHDNPSSIPSLNKEGRKESTPESCLLISMCILAHETPHMHTK